MTVTVVVPVYNEEDNIAPLAAELAALRPRVPGLDVLLVDDGSTDRTWERIADCARRIPGLHGLRCLRNRGQSSAMLAGLRRAAGDVVVTMDGDMQNNPADIPALLAALEGFDAVCGYRARRRDTPARRIASRLANRIRNRYTHDGMRDTGCSLKAFRKACVADLPDLNGVHRFMPAYFKLAGRRVREIPVDHRPRTRGTSKYTNLKRLPRTVYDLIGFVWYRKRHLPPLGPADIETC